MLAAKGQPIDVLTAVEELNATADLEEVGKPDLAELLSRLK